MAAEFIVPLTSLSTGSSNLLTHGGQVNNGVPFADVFHDLIDNVAATDDSTKQGTLSAVSGESDLDRLHELTIASTKSEMALKLFVQLRNKGHEAYSEIMRMGV